MGVPGVSSMGSTSDAAEDPEAQRDWDPTDVELLRSTMAELDDAEDVPDVAGVDADVEEQEEADECVVHADNACCQAAIEAGLERGGANGRATGRATGLTNSMMYINSAPMQLMDIPLPHCCDIATRERLGKPNVDRDRLKLHTGFKDWPAAGDGWNTARAAEVTGIPMERAISRVVIHRPNSSLHRM